LYNINQLEAIQSEENKLVIIAPPGSGKTHTMTGAIENFIKTKSPKKVVAVTFTNKAADELRDRLFDFGKVLHVSTIHSWSYSELKRLSETYNFRIRLLEEEQVKNIIKPLMEEYDVNMRNINYVYNHCIGNINPDLPMYVKAKYNAIQERYIAFKRKKLLYDFTDLPLYLKTKLEDNDEYIEIDGLFVDEFQDVDPIQLTVFERVNAAKKFFIGDPDQSIYMFRGATDEIFRMLPDFKVYELNRNYRSFQVILNFAMSFHDQHPSSLKLIYYTDDKNNIIADRGDKDGYVFQELYQNHMLMYHKDSYSEKKVKANETIKNELTNFQYMILCRTNRQVKELQEKGYPNVSTIHKAKGLEYDNVLVVDFDIEGDEDRNVAFVALTRAKNRLIVAQYETMLKLVDSGMLHILAF
jgi:superfamily I DNA/RNA helicase